MAEHDFQGRQIHQASSEQFTARSIGEFIDRTMDRSSKQREF
jgi:hypothetical protein